MQVVTETDPDDEGQDDRCDADGGNAVASFEFLPVEVLPHLEHVGADPEQAEALDQEQDVRLEDLLPLVNPDHLAEDHLGEDDAREHLHDDPRHADLFRDLAEHERDEEDGRGDREEADHGVNEQAGKHHGG